jgi:SAM-dependent methyltransferase
MNRFYQGADSLFVKAYDAFYAAGAPVPGDVAFYERLAHEAGGPVLELACGTGRIALALVEKGLDVTGVDVSDGMLAVARRKAAGCSASVRERLALINQDMSALNLGRRFGFVFVPARSFQHLLTIDLQKKIAGSHPPPSGADWPLGPAFVRSPSRFAERAEDYGDGAFRHPS